MSSKSDGLGRPVITATELDLLSQSVRTVKRRAIGDPTHSPEFSSDSHKETPKDKGTADSHERTKA